MCGAIVPPQPPLTRSGYRNALSLFLAKLNNIKSDCLAEPFWERLILDRRS
jgi:hypothetical protein